MGYLIRENKDDIDHKIRKNDREKERVSERDRAKDGMSEKERDKEIEKEERLIE